MANYQAGELKIESMTIVNQYGESVDVSKIAIGCRLYESIYSKFITGDVSILDGLNLLKNYRFTGQETMRIFIRSKFGDKDYTVDDDSIDCTFRIYKVANVQRPGQQILAYQLKLCDPRMMTARTTRVSQVLRGSYSDMLLKIVTPVTGMNIQNTDIVQWSKTLPENMQFVSPNWSVGRLMDYFTTEGSTGPDKTSYKNGMFLFQTLNGGFHFTDINTMMSQEYPLEFSYAPRNTAPTDDININAPSGLNTQITHVEKPQVFDTLAGMVGGAYASSMSVYDAVKKQDTTYTFDVEESYKKGNHVSGEKGFPLVRTEEMEITLKPDVMSDPMISPDSGEVDANLAINQNFQSVVEYGYTPNHSFDDAKDVTSKDVFFGNHILDNAPLERKALLEILQQHRIRITIPLRTDLTVGQVIKLLIPEPESQHGNTDTKDKLNDNRYLIIDQAINFDPLGNNGVCYLECVKESYTMKVDDATPMSSSSDPREV